MSVVVTPRPWQREDEPQERPFGCAVCASSRGAFTSTATAHGGQESTLLSLSNVFYHCGGIIVPPGFTSPIQFQLGNPYGVSHTSGRGEQPGDTELNAARYQAQRAVQIATALKRGRRLDQAS